MASEERINRLKELTNEIRGVDKEKLLRASLGEASLEQEFAPRLTKIEDKFQFALDHASEVDDNNVQSSLGIF